MGLHYLIHEFLADWTNILGQSGAEHHDLLLVGCGFEHFLYITTHVYKEETPLSLDAHISYIEQYVHEI